MVSRKDLNKAELETVGISKIPTTVVTANGEVVTKEETTVYVKELDLFVTAMLLEDRPAVLSLGILCEELGTVTIGRVVKNHISSRKARKFIATHQIMYHSSYLVYPRVPLPHQLLLHLTRRSERASEDSSARGNSWHESTENDNRQNKWRRGIAE